MYLLKRFLSNVRNLMKNVANGDIFWE